MRVIALVLASLAVAIARPQFRLTSKEYEAFQASLDGRIPVAITSGQLLYSAVDESPNNFVVVDFGGASSSAVGGASSGEPRNAPAEIEKTAVAPAIDLLSAPALAEDVAAAPVAESRSAPVAAEDIAIAPMVPKEAIVAPPAAENEVAVGSALIRRKRQLLEDEEPISNARQIGTGLGTAAGLFGSTIGRFLDSTAAAFSEMIDGLEGLGTITLDQIENSFDDDPSNDFIRR